MPLNPSSADPELTAALTKLAAKLAANSCAPKQAGFLQDNQLPIGGGLLGAGLGGLVGAMSPDTDYAGHKHNRGRNALTGALAGGGAGLGLGYAGKVLSGQGEHPSPKPTTPDGREVNPETIAAAEHVEHPHPYLIDANPLWPGSKANRWLTGTPDESGGFMSRPMRGPGTGKWFDPKFLAREAVRKMTGATGNP